MTNGIASQITSVVCGVAPLGVLDEGVIMNKENVAKVAAALRSGEYEQGRNMLRTNDDSYCCLGVACDVSGLGQWEKRQKLLLDEYEWEYVIRDENGEKVVSDSATLPAPVAQWLGIAADGEFFLPDAPIRYYTEEGTDTNYHNNICELTSLNDEGMPFAQIADILEHAEAFTWTKPFPMDEDED